MRFADYSAPIHLTAPGIGEHTRAILTELGGVSADELRRLEEQGVVFCAP